MSATSRFDIFTNVGKGNGYFISTLLTGGNTTTAATSTSGLLTLRVHANSIGSSVPGTLGSIPKPTLTPAELYSMYFSAVTTAGKGGFFCNFYKLGTLNLAATGDQFTHDTATFPLLKTVYGQASQPISLIPIVLITTATATTAPAFRLRTAGGSAGYVDQDGNNVIGTKTFTMPSATTASQSTFVLRLEDGDSGVRDISAIEVTTAGTAGAATIYGMELLSPITMTTGIQITVDSMFAQFIMSDISTATATSGTATCVFGMVSGGSTGTLTPSVTIQAGQGI